MRWAPGSGFKLALKARGHTQHMDADITSAAAYITNLQVCITTGDIVKQYHYSTSYIFSTVHIKQFNFVNCWSTFVRKIFFHVHTEKTPMWVEIKH